ncbi:putative non-inhibitory serpin-10 [Panicum virgatum]|nr:putative non-inhibitory serpin-10 [Panicum virgatum]
MEAIAKQSNFLFSPMSIRAGLALLAAGTHGPTLRQLLTFLGSEDTHHLDEASARLLANVGAWPQLSFAAAIFVDRSLNLTPEFASSAASAHQAAARSVDFENRPAAALAEVNAFIAQATAGRLRNVLPEGAVGGGTTKVVLANGLHFKATWARRFDPSNTVRRHFLRRDGSPPVRVPFLSDAGRHYAESFDAPGLGFKVLQLFYKMVGRDGRLDFGAPCFSMLVFLPHRRDGLAYLLRLAVTQPDFVMRCVPRRQQLVCPCMVPKFRFSCKFDARNALRQLGLSAPFDKDVADLSGMVSNMPPEGLYVSAVRQACAVEVDEEGTTAVAATYSASSPTYSPPAKPPPPPMSFVAEHPFMFAIVEYEKAEVLFLGHVMDPSKKD